MVNWVQGFEPGALLPFTCLCSWFTFITVHTAESGQIDKEMVRLILYILYSRHGAFNDQQTTRKKTFLWLDHGQ